MILGAFLWSNHQSELVDEKIVASEQEMAALQKEMEKFAANAYGEASYFKRQLGVIENADTISKPYIRLIRLPVELGGGQMYGLPFTWQWRMVLPNPKDFELCWAIHEIPPGNSFDIPEEHLHRSHLNLKDGIPRQGLLHFSKNNERPLTLDQPLVVTLYFRIDGDSERGDVFINYQIDEPSKLNRGGGAIKRGEFIALKSEDVSWLQECTTCRGSYGAISGLAIEHDYNQVPLLDQNFSLDEPFSLLKIRSRKKLGPIKYAPFKGPCAGLQVWIQKRSGPSTDLPNQIQIQPSPKQARQ